ncbi:two pore domain potassium channel family protein [Flavobacterium aquariorum]|uniref:Two pore domain potassium channel family protein n=1 Tax=Flavobacterium aquariorum TaxID=2217670 RepID=A0A2W7TVL2_9FLAO|nr:potassium channel family protein [Flavobacterium aquariorum]PZX92790.1 two pore domain potassium channel family protein [Flavobacterium aquariorum]
MAEKKITTYYLALITFLDILFKGQPKARLKKKLIPAYKNNSLNIMRIWKNKKYNDFGTERFIRLFLAISQFIFPGLLVRHVSGKYGLLSRKLYVELYVIIKILIPILIFKLDLTSNAFMTAIIFYLMIETVLYLATLIYLSNEFAEPVSYRRSLTFLFLNFIEIVLYFAVIYSYFNNHYSNFLNKKFVTHTDAIYFSFVTSSTLGYGDYFPTSILAKRFIIFQIILFFIFVGLFLNFFASRIQNPTYYNAGLSKNKKQQ